MSEYLSIASLDYGYIFLSNVYNLFYKSLTMYSYLYIYIIIYKSVYWSEYKTYILLKKLYTMI
jgi:hypothetical protein